MVDLPEVHARALDARARSVAGVGDDQWGSSVRLRRLDGARAREPHRHRQLLGGRARRGPDRSRTVGDRLDGDVLGADPLRAYDDSSLVAAAAFRAPGAMEAPCAVSYGPVPGEVYCGHRFIDVLIHGWDVASSTGQDTTLDPELVEACFEVVEPQLDMLVGSGMFGTPARRPGRRRAPDRAARGARPPRLTS